MSKHNVFYTTDGVFVFGNNEHGQLGLGDIKDRKVPTKLDFNYEIISISCGYDYTIINTTNGLFVFGCNNRGQLGLGDTEDRLVPIKLKFDHEIISIVCGNFHTIINTTDGLYVFGNNTFGQLGLGDKQKRLVPTKLEFGHDIKSIVCGEYHTIINTTDGLFVFGDNEYGQLGLGNRKKQLVPIKLNFFKSSAKASAKATAQVYETLEILSICCGDNHTIINTTDGLFVFGYNFNGQLGLGDNLMRLIPTKLEFFKDLEIISIYCGRAHTMIYTTDGFFVFGYNFDGQLGLGDGMYRLKPTKLEFFKDLEIISISCGDDHTIINTTDGLFVFGANFRGQLGLGDIEYKKEPTKLNFVEEIILLDEKRKRIKSCMSSDCLF